MTKRLAQQIDAVMKKIANRAAGFDHRIARVGVLETSHYPDGTPVAYVAAIQEHGAPEVKIPARPFFRPTISEKQEEWARHLGDGAKAVIRQQMTADEVLTSVGAEAAGDVARKISELEAPALSPITVMLRGMKSSAAGKNRVEHVTGKTVGEAAQRVADGKTNYGASTKPLVDDGYLLGSINNDVADEDA